MIHLLFTCCGGDIAQDITELLNDYYDYLKVTKELMHEIIIDKKDEFFSRANFLYTNWTEMLLRLILIPFGQRSDRL